MPNGIIYKYFIKLYFSVNKIKIKLCYISAEFRINDVFFLIYGWNKNKRFEWTISNRCYCINKSIYDFK